MNREQRNYGRAPRKNDSDVGGLRALTLRSKNSSEIEEVLPPRSRRVPLTDKLLFNRSCWTSPDKRSFAQLTRVSDSPSQYESTTEGNNGPNLPDLQTFAKLRSLREAFCGSPVRVEGAQHPPDERYQADEQWQKVNDADDIDKFVLKGRDEGTLTRYHSRPKNFHISDAPRVKVIAEKFTKFKKHNIELRKLEERVVCVEYDVFNQVTGVALEPQQRMRAFFTIKPVDDENEVKVLKELPPNIKNKFNISSHDLQRWNQNEVEIIDGKILENQPYLEDLQKILRRKRSFAKRDKNTLNLQNLYELAKRDLLDFDSNFDENLFSKEELLDVQNLILGNCKSSIHGISRRTVDATSRASSISLSANTISRSLVNELLR